MEEKLQKLLQNILPADKAAMEEAGRRQAQLAKPPGSLGRLEDLSIQLAGRLLLSLPGKSGGIRS